MASHKERGLPQLYETFRVWGPPFLVCTNECKEGAARLAQAAKLCMIMRWTDTIDLCFGSIGQG